MGNYEKAMEMIIEEELEGLDTKYVVRENGDDGFEYRMGFFGCQWCEHNSFVPFSGGVCSYEQHTWDDSIRKVNDGEIYGGECYKFVSLEEFWDGFSNTHAINPESGEVYIIY